MKSAAYCSALAFALFSQRGLAFPAYGLPGLPPEAAAKLERHENAIEKRVTFDPTTQYVSNQGVHAFIAPSATDQRGPCPGLNAMANHGYLPRNGIADIPTFISSTFDVFGMGSDLASFLAVYGAVFDGDLTSWSIGGPDPSLQNLGGLLGQPQGMSGSHNHYEGDVSPIRGDLYEYGNDYKVNLGQFQQLYDLGKAADDYNLDNLLQYRVERFQQSVDNNPYFFNAPFSGVVASPAAWSFIYRFMANKSAEYPEGQLNGAVLKSFYGVTGADGAFEASYERIPNNWYKRAVLDSYTIPLLSLDSNKMLLEYPEFGSVGGNTGTTNSFVGIDPQDLTGGVYNAATLTQGNNLMCYGLRAGFQQAPDILGGLFTDITPAMSTLGAAINKATDSLGCPALDDVDQDQFDAQFQKYPGYTQLKSDGSY